MHGLGVVLMPMFSNALGKVIYELNPILKVNARNTGSGPRTLIENTACFSATYTEATMHFASARQLKVSPFMRKRSIMTADTLSDALRACDTYATQKVLRGPLALGYESCGHSTSLLTWSSLLRSARWRQAPATESQKAFIKKRWGKRMMDRAGVAEVTEKLTKGEAANIITRLKHGAQVYSSVP